jgi:hypothetical protein
VLDFASKGSVGSVMALAPPSYPASAKPFGRRRTPPLTAEQRSASLAAAREAEHQAQQDRIEAYHQARWDEDRIKFQAVIREAEGAIARRRLGAMGCGALEIFAGFVLGLRLGR